MVYDKKIADLFIFNFNEAYRSAKLLLSSFERISSVMPLTALTLNSLSLDALEKLDAFRVRYCDLQDSLGNKVFRSVLIFEEEVCGTNLDVLNKMEKRQIIKSFDGWKIVRNIRNLFAHDYSETEESKAEVLNIAYASALSLVETVDNVCSYIQEKYHFPMERFPFLKTK